MFVWSNTCRRVPAFGLVSFSRKVERSTLSAPCAKGKAASVLSNECVRKFSSAVDAGAWSDFQALEAEPWSVNQAGIDDRTQIINVLHQYTWLIDNPPRDDLSSVFTNDVVFELPKMDAKFEGRDVVTKMIKDMDHLDYCRHFVSNIQVKIQGDSAISRCYFSGAAGRAGTPGGDHLSEGGRYIRRVSSNR